MTTELNDADADALTVDCPVCFSKPGQRCTSPDSRGRHEVKLPHWSRVFLMQEQRGEEPTITSHDIEKE